MTRNPPSPPRASSAAIHIAAISAAIAIVPVATGTAAGATIGRNRAAVSGSSSRATAVRPSPVVRNAASGLNVQRGPKVRAASEADARSESGARKAANVRNAAHARNAVRGPTREKDPNVVSDLSAVVGSAANSDPGTYRNSHLPRPRAWPRKCR